MSVIKLEYRFEGASHTVKGRQAWALHRLLCAGEAGCTPLENPAPRWSAYVHELRKRGLIIETITEEHGGAYAGHHARYVLRSHVEVISAHAK